MKKKSFLVAGQFYVVRDFSGDVHVGEYVSTENGQHLFTKIAWIAYTAVRLGEMMASGPVKGKSECEAYPDDVNMSFPVDAVRIADWKHGRVSSM